MTVFACILVSALAVIGVLLSFLELYRVRRARGASFICLCFREELLGDGAKPDMLIICRTDADSEEIIRRVSDSDGRRVYIKRW